MAEQKYEPASTAKSTAVPTPTPTVVTGFPVGVDAAKVHLQGGYLMQEVHGGEVKAYPKDVIVSIAGEALVMSEAQYVALGGDYDSIEDFSEAVAILKHARDGGMTKEEAEEWYTENKPPEAPVFDPTMWDEPTLPIKIAGPDLGLELKPADELPPEFTRPKVELPMVDPPKASSVLPKPTQLPAK